jgi:hypothetical protein
MRRLWLISIMMALGTVLGYAQQSAPTGSEINQINARDVHFPVVISHPVPKVPPRFAAKGINIRCAASVTVDVDGIPNNIKIIRCSDSEFAKYYVDLVSQFRYKPATTLDGKPIAVKTTERVDFRFNGDVYPGDVVRLGFGTPPGVLSPEPDANGVYPLTKKATPPTLVKFSSKDYGDVAFMNTGSSPCDIVLTISEKGKASEPVVTYCERPLLEKPAIDSLLKSTYKPGRVNGKAVAMRASVHLEYGDVPAKL